MSTPHDPSCVTAAGHDASQQARTDASCSTAAGRVASRLPRLGGGGSSCDAGRVGPGQPRRLTPSGGRVCAWCAGPIPDTTRRDAVCCSVRCRQARHRFTRTVGQPPSGHVDSGRARRLAYADPPYPGNAHLYRDHPDYRGEVDHTALIHRLSTYDGWALSTSATALPTVLALCPPGVRVAAWHRGERPTRSFAPLSAWEPVIYHGARPVDPPRGFPRRVDSLVHGVAPMTTLPGRVIGTKPAAFCRWLFQLLGALPGDSLDDLFPGSGAVTRAWTTFTTGPDPSRQARHDSIDPRHGGRRERPDW
jgi:hypothetical protein